MRLPLPPGDIRPGKVILGIRPQEFSLAEAPTRSCPSMTVEPAVVEELGSETHAIFPIDAPSVDSEEIRATTDEGDSSVAARVDRRALFTASLPEGTEVVIGSRCASRSTLRGSISSIPRRARVSITQPRSRSRIAILDRRCGHALFVSG